MSENPFDSLRPPVEKPEEKPKNLVTYRKGEQGEVTVDLNNLADEDLFVLSDSILEHEPDSMLGMQAQLFTLIEEAKTAEGEKKEELKKHIARAKGGLYKKIDEFNILDNQITRLKGDRGFIEEIRLRSENTRWLEQTLTRLMRYFILNKSLDFSMPRTEYGDLGSEGSFVLAASPYLRQIVHLNLNNNNLSSEDVRTIVTSSNFGQPNSMDLSFNELGSKGVRILVDSPNLDQLQSLNLRNCHPGVIGLAVLAKANNLPNLKNLYIDLNSNSQVVKGAINALEARGVKIS